VTQTILGVFIFKVIQGVQTSGTDYRAFSA